MELVSKYCKVRRPRDIFKMPENLEQKAGELLRKQIGKDAFSFSLSPINNYYSVFLYEQNIEWCPYKPSIKLKLNSMSLTPFCFLSTKRGSFHERTSNFHNNYMEK